MGHVMRYAWGLQVMEPSDCYARKLMVLDGHAPAQWRTKRDAISAAIMFGQHTSGAFFSAKPIPKIFPESEV